MKKILIIDDCKTTVEILRATLVDAGYDVDFVHDGEAGVARVVSWCPDLIILDVIMPGMDGLSSLFKIRNLPEHAFTPVMIHSSKNNMKDPFADKNIIGFFDKPINTEQLLRIVKSALH